MSDGNLDNSWSIDYELYLWLVDNLKGKDVILELGSGTGTLELKKRWEVISVEHDESFLNIKDHNYIYAPLVKHKEIKNYPSENLWYDRKVLQKELKKLDYSVILVDGPPAPNRVGLIKYWDLFKPDVIWIFDDLHREQERKLIYGISNRLERPYTVFNAYGKGKPFGVIYA